MSLTGDLLKKLKNYFRITMTTIKITKIKIVLKIVNQVSLIIWMDRQEEIDQKYQWLIR